jgi:sulfur-carrier protein
VSPGSVKVRVRIPAALRALSGGQAEAAGEGRTVGDVLRDLGRSHPLLLERILDGEGRPRRYVSLFLNDVDLRGVGGLEAAVREGDELIVVPALAGGAPCP